MNEFLSALIQRYEELFPEPEQQDIKGDKNGTSEQLEKSSLQRN